jgi:hypothetical protein
MIAQRAITIFITNFLYLNEVLSGHLFGVTIAILSTKINYSTGISHITKCFPFFHWDCDAIQYCPYHGITQASGSGDSHVNY